MKRSLRQRNKSSRRGKRLTVQSLEKRQLMAADIGLVDGYIAISGTEMDDVAEVYSESGGVVVKISSFGPDGELDSKSGTFDQSEVKGILFHAGEGDDLIVNDTNLDSVTRAGGGNDTVLSGGGNDILVMGTGDDFVLSGGGDDLILGGPGDDVMIDLPASTPVDENPVDETPVDETPVDETPVDETSVEDAPADEQGVDEATPEGELIDEPTAGGSDEPEEIAEEEDTVGEPETQSAEDDEVEDTATIADDAMPADDGGVVLEDAPEQQSVDEDFGCKATDTIDGESSEDVQPEGESLDPIEGESGVEGSEPETSTVVLPENGNGTDAAEGELLDPPADLADDEETGGEIADAPEDVVDELDDEEGQSESDNDVIFGGTGDDWIFGESGSDLIFGGSSAVDDALLRMVIAGRLSLQ